MHRLLLVLSLGLAAPASAQDYLSRADFAAVTAENAFCYRLLVDGSCGWVEVYPASQAADLSLQIATILPSGDMLVMTQEASFVGDGLCIRDTDFGIVTASFGVPPYYYFDQNTLVAQGEETLREIIGAIGPDVPPKTCFFYARDPARLDGLMQHVFSNGIRQDGEEPITLVPLTQGSVVLTPQG